MDLSWWPCLFVLLTLLGPSPPSSSAALGLGPASLGADTTTLGVVWSPPSSPDSAHHELKRIAEIGATAVRLPHLPSDFVAAHADSLGLELFVDVPVDYVAGPQVRDTLARIAPAVKRLRALARQHPAITHIGLGHALDTTVPAACETLRTWTERLHDGAPALRTYYVTPFRASADQCDGAVDRVLLDLRGLSSPVERWHRWRAHTESVGIGALGTWRRPTAAAGYRVPHSPHHQARYLEQALHALLDSSSAMSPTVFVARWQDQPTPLLPSRRYGLHTRSGSPSPSAQVVRGFYTGQQRVFAFPAGPANTRGPYRLVLLGWGLIILLGLLYAGTPFVRETVNRYFTAPGFYRDALRDGRDLSLGGHGFLLALVAGALGTIGACAARFAATAPATEHVLAALPIGVRFVLAGSLEHPLTAGLLTAGSVLTLLLAWIIGLVLAARWETWFSAAQGLALVVWPCWPVLPVLLLALAAGPDAQLSPSLLGLLLVAGGPLALLYITGRVLFDYWAVTNLPAWTLVPLFLLSPFSLTTLAVLLYATYFDLSLPFLWHLATLT